MSKQSKENWPNNTKRGSNRILFHFVNSFTLYIPKEFTIIKQKKNKI